MNKRIQFSLALALAAPTWLVTAHAAQDEGQQMQGQMQEQQTQGQTSSELMNMTAGQVADMKLKNDEGKKIGDIEEIVQNKTDGKLNAVVSVGGFLGLGKKRVAIPLDQLRLQQGELVAQGMTKEQLEQQQAYKDQDYEVVEKSTILASVTGGAQPGGGARLSFEQLDLDQDGNITKEEAQSAPELSQNWQQYDTNQDGQLDQSEFSAFESRQQTQPMMPEDQQ